MWFEDILVLALITDLQATREQVEASNKELEQAEVELEREIGKL